MDRLIEFVANHPFLVGVTVAFLVLFIFNEIKRGGKVLTAQQLVNQINTGSTVVLDIRDKNDFLAGHILDSINIPYATLKERIVELERYKTEPVVIACKMGQHSSSAGTILRRAGFQNVARLRGGITEWRSLNMPVVKK